MSMKKYVTTTSYSPCWEKAVVKSPSTRTTDVLLREVSGKVRGRSWLECVEWWDQESTNGWREWLFFARLVSM